MARLELHGGLVAWFCFAVDGGPIQTALWLEDGEWIDGNWIVVFAHNLVTAGALWESFARGWQRCADDANENGDGRASARDWHNWIADAVDPSSPVR